MKIFCPFLLSMAFVLLCESEASAQTNVYHPFPDSAFWRVDYYKQPFQMDWCFKHYYFHYYIFGDTIINSKIYKKIFRSNVLTNVPGCSAYGQPPASPPSGYVGSIRDDSAANKTYFIFKNTNTDSLLYDYNLKVGDTIKGALYLPPIKSFVQSIDSVLIRGKYRRRWNLDTCINFSPYIIEGIGASVGLIEPLCTNAIDFMIRNLICVNDSAGTIFNSGYSSLIGCNLVSSVNEDSFFENIFSVFPNPSTGKFTIQSSDPSISLRATAVEIYNLFGEQVYHTQIFKSSNCQIDLSSQPCGVYFLILKVKDEIFAKKLVKN